MTIAITILISLLVGYFAGRVHQVFAFQNELIEEKKMQDQFRQFFRSSQADINQFSRS